MKNIHIFGPTYIDHSISLKDNISLDGSARIEKENYYPGGTGLCYSIALARLKNYVTLHSIVGNDSNSKIINNFIRAENNLKAILQKIEGSTDYAYILLDKGNHKTVASKKEISNNFSADSIKIPRKCDAIVLTTFRNSIIKKILLSIVSHSKPFVLWAPHLSNCSDIVEMKDQLHLIDHITLSAEEYSEIRNIIGDPLKYGIKSLTVTSGPKGCDLITSQGIDHFDSIFPLKSPLDTNGAGEAFGSGFLTAFLNCYDYKKSVKIASYMGYLHVQRFGSDFPKLDVSTILEIEAHKNSNLDFIKKAQPYLET